MGRRIGAEVLFALGFIVAGAAIGQAQVVNSEWNTGNGDWNVAANWFPSAAPDNGGGFTYNVQIGNRPVALGAQVDFVPVSGTSDTITSLTVSNNADLTTNGNQLNVLTATIIDGVGTTIRVDPHATPGTAALTSLDLNLNNGGGLTMAGGIVGVTRELEINAGSVLGGHGTVNVGDGDGVVEQAFENSALIQVQGNTAAPQTLTIHANGVDTIDLDGDSETGVVDVDNALANVNADTVTLVIDGPLADSFGGVAGAAIQIGQRDTLTFNDDFAIAGPAAITMNGGNAVATLNGPGNITSITGATFTITGAAVIENDMTFSGTANVITVNANSSLELGGDVAIPDASALVLSASTSQLVVTGATTINEAAGDFNWDGTGNNATTTVETTGHLSITVDQVDVGNDLFNGTINLNGNGDLTVNNTINSWQAAGEFNKNGAGTSSVNGDEFAVTADLNVNAGTLDVNADAIFGSTSDVVIASGATALMATTQIFNGADVTVNGTLSLGLASILEAPATLTGTGLFRFNSTSTVTANAVVNTTSFDWDGTGAGSLHTINDGVIFTINSTIWDADDAGDVDDPINLGGNGASIVVNNVPSWTMARTLTANTAGAGTATLGGTSRLIFSGALSILSVNGNTTANAPITFGSSATTIAAARILRLAGGDNNTNTNVMSGGTIGGAGTLAANDARELRGFGNIGATIDFDNTARLRADNGTLTISGAILDVGVIGTADADGVLNVTNAWNTNVAAGVALLGGTVQGGTITNDTAQGIQGFGTVTSRVINNTQLLSFNGGTLIFETAADDNDWDGAAGNGLLRASPGTTLDVRDSGPAFPFAGTVQVDAGARVFVNDPDNLPLGFALNFLPAADLNLNGGTYEAASSTDLAGTTTVAAGPESTIKVRNNTFLTFATGSTITLNGNLRLENNNINVEDLANFSGTGALKVVNGSHMVIDDQADVGVLLEMYGALRPGNSEGIGVANLTNYQQFPTGQLFVELRGTSLNQFDRLAATGVVIVDGYLNIDLDNMFAPVLGNTFNIITGANVTGQFDYYDIDNVAEMPAGLAFKINYLANAVQLEVVNKPIFSADFDDDGDVDLTDLNEYWKDAFNLNQLGDADGDNDSDGNDFLLWQRQLGSKPTAVAAGGAVPEPATGLMAVLVAAGMLAASRKRAA
jgi:hypothetical protein